MIKFELKAVFPKRYKRTKKSDHKAYAGQNIPVQNFEAQRKDKKSFLKELRQVYSAATEEAALNAFDRLDEDYGVRNTLCLSEPGDRIGFLLPHFSNIRMK